jgi:hypothetical protein
MDTSNVLLLSHLENFREGTILVREKQGLRFDIFRSYTTAKDTAGAIKALHKYGSEEPQLYPAALAYFTSSPEILQEAGDELDAVLKKIDDDGLMAPLQVIQTLSANGVATMGMIKKYLSDTLERERQEIANVCFWNYFLSYCFLMTTNNINRIVASLIHIATIPKRNEQKQQASPPSPKPSTPRVALLAQPSSIYRLSISCASIAFINVA